LELEAGLMNGWVRFWFRGKLLPLPGDMQRELDAMHQRLAQEKQRADRLEQEIARLRAQLGQRPSGSDDS
jgi:hypothetical protein